MSYIYSMNDTLKNTCFGAITYRELYNGMKLGSIKFCRIVKYVVSPDEAMVEEYILLQSWIIE